MSKTQKNHKIIYADIDANLQKSDYSREDVCLNNAEKSRFYFFQETAANPNEVFAYCSKIGGKAAILNEEKVTDKIIADNLYIDPSYLDYIFTGIGIIWVS